MSPKVNEVWLTKEGHLVLIVNADGELKMLWFDEIDGTFNASDIMNRLKEKTTHSLAEWVEFMKISFKSSIRLTD